MAVLGIDLGTSAVKTIIVDVSGRIMSAGRAEYAIAMPHPGWAEGDPAQWWQSTIAATREALARLPEVAIAAIGLAGQMHGLVLADGAGQPVRPALVWADTRAEAELARYRALPAEMLLCLGNPLVPGMAGPLLCWLDQNEPGTYQAARWALQPKDWLRLRLTDIAATDPSDASATLLYDLPADRWADEIIDALGLRRDLLAPIVPSGAVAGRLTERSAAALGLPAGLPVASGAADTAAALLGTGLVAPGPIQMTLGTGAQIVQVRDTPEIDATGRTHLYRAADGTHWYAMAAVQNAGLALDWVLRLLGATWDNLFASADAVAPGANGLLFLPFLTRERLHRASIRDGGAFLGLRSYHRREHLLHAALEGVACNVREALEALPGADSAAALCVAGGASTQASWLQMLADILDRELVAVDVPNASARGAALLGGIAADIWPDASAAAALAPERGLTVSPDPGRAALYQALFARFAALVSPRDRSHIHPAPMTMQQSTTQMSKPAETP
jgi:xylulokinase